MSESMQINGQELKFPVEWEYRVVAESEKFASVRAAVEACLASHGINGGTSEGLQSGGGRYRTLKAKVTLENRGMMNHLSAELGKIDGVKFLL